MMDLFNFLAAIVTILSVVPLAAEIRKMIAEWRDVGRATTDRVAVATDQTSAARQPRVSSRSTRRRDAYGLAVIATKGLVSLGAIILMYLMASGPTAGQPATADQLARAAMCLIGVILVNDMKPAA